MIVFFGNFFLAMASLLSTRLPGDREQIRQFSTISLLNLLRLRLDAG